MEKKVYVIGHKNPDTDSVAAAIAYAELKRRQGWPNVVAAMAGEPNPQTRFILDRLGIHSPLYLADVHPKVRDVLQRIPVTVDAATPLLKGLELFHQNNIRVLPVVDGAGIPTGLVSLLKLSEKYLLTGQDRLRGVDTSLASLCHCLQGTFLAGGPAEGMEHLHLFIGAMLEESFSARIDGYDSSSLLIMTGNRRTIQQAAIEKGVRLLVVTGGLEVEEDLVRLATASGVTLISTPFDTATAAWLARLSTPVGHFAEGKFEQIGIAEPLSHLRLKLLHGGESAVVVVEEDGTLAGIATKSSLLATVPYALILVDHNELGQAVPGAEEVEILEVIDHHKLGNPPTNQPISFIASPVGSTCTLVATLYRQQGIEPPPEIAALLLAGLLSDTVILKSPTTTDTDRELALWLETKGGMDHLAFGREIFSASSGLESYGSPEKVITTDFKSFSGSGGAFGVGQVEVIGFDEFHSQKNELRLALARIKERDGLQLAGLMVTDIYSETTLFLVEGGKALAHVMDYPQLEPHLYELKGVMSRKKQMVPHLLKVLGKL
ncbi:putative manganese-dependent inorganic diphosphatase [Geobacter sp. AOG1]|uniref:putative manganese-dependent inorganic diphosphatase n=1 Tax=Geobacter sp. AOG1 TaxID=1566346 RepID=UPI001CC52B3C|nr:putative manganese-dependent inorganic diphosphatase [Geobacter sp. AOG1]GFE56464.1 manganese-dependent inorganic pyrophosphatase [Geobacter sp. AOG1]